MNRRTAYEKIIAAKAERQAVPDMSDAIWAAVSAELDQLPPVSGDGSQARIAHRGGASMLRIIGYVVMAAVATVLIIWFSRQQKKSLPQKKETPPFHITAPANERRHIDTATMRPAAPVIIQPPQRDAPVIDSAVQIARPLENKTELKGIRIIPPNTPSLVIKDSLQNISPHRPPRGVPGIGNNDYKIVPAGRDSTAIKNHP